MNGALTIGQRVRAIRKTRGWTQVQLAAKAGIGQSAISSIEIGDTLWLRGGNLLRIASALGVSPKWLENGIGDPQAPIDSTTDEAAAVELLRSLSAANRRAWIAAGRSLLESQGDAEPSTANPFPKAKTRPK